MSKASQATQFKRGTTKAKSHGRKGGKKSRPPGKRKS
jgi:hypothetical protein